MSEDLAREDSKRNRMGVAGFVISILVLVGFILLYFFGVIVAVGFFALSVAGLIVSAVGLSKKPRVFAILGLVISLIAGSVWALMGVVYFTFAGGGGFTLTTGDLSSFTFKTLAAEVWMTADSEGRKLGKKPPPTEKSGSLPEAQWANPNGKPVTLEITWARDGSDFLVTVTPKAPLPKGVTAKPVTARVLSDGEVAFSMTQMREWNSTLADSDWGEMTTVFSLVLDALEKDVSTVTTWAKAHDGKLPDTKAGQGLINKSVVSVDVEGITFQVNTEKYKEMPNDRFMVELMMKEIGRDGKESENSKMSAEFTAQGLYIDPIASFFQSSGYGSPAKTDAGTTKGVESSEH